MNDDVVAACREGNSGFAVLTVEHENFFRPVPELIPKLDVAIGFGVADSFELFPLHAITAGGDRDVLAAEDGKLLYLGLLTVRDLSGDVVCDFGGQLAARVDVSLIGGIALHINTKLALE